MKDPDTHAGRRYDNHSQSSSVHLWIGRKGFENENEDDQP